MLTSPTGLSGSKLCILMVKKDTNSCFFLIAMWTAEGGKCAPLPLLFFPHSETVEHVRNK